MLELDAFLEYFRNLSQETFCVCILNKKIFRISDEPKASCEFELLYFRIIGYAYQAHMLEMPKIQNKKLTEGFHYAIVENGVPKLMPELSDEMKQQHPYSMHVIMKQTR